MRIKKRLHAITFLLIAFSFPALGTAKTDVNTPKNKATAKRPAHAPTKLQPIRVPQTGQKSSFGPRDDGALRSGAPLPSPRFTDNKDGTVTDRLTGLMWTKNADKFGKVDWEEALSKSAECKDGQHKDWRLPNRKELLSLVDLGRTGPALPADHPFTNVKPNYYWSSTTIANNDDIAWILHFHAGMVTSDDKGGTHYVWLVRSLD
jgi:hypothetical protein